MQAGFSESGCRRCLKGRTAQQWRGAEVANILSTATAPVPTHHHHNTPTRAQQRPLARPTPLSPMARRRIFEPGPLTHQVHTQQKVTGIRQGRPAQLLTPMASRKKKSRAEQRAGVRGPSRPSSAGSAAFLQARGRGWWWEWRGGRRGVGGMLPDVICGCYLLSCYL